MKYMEDALYLADVRETVGNVKNIDYFAGKKICVLGASGLIGSFLTDCMLYAIDAGMISGQVYAVGRKRERLAERFGEETGRLHFIESDVMAFAPDIAPDVIIDAAGFGHPRAFRESPVEVLLSNVAGVSRVMETARRNPGCRVLYVSSGEAQEETDHLTVRACYPVGKKAAETLCLSYIQEYRVDAVIARPCHTFGGNFTEGDNRATAQFIAAASESRDIVMNSPGRQVRSFAYVSDCVSGLLTALACGKTGEVYGVSSDETCSVRQFADKCAQAAKTGVAFKEADERERAEASPIKGQVVDNADLKGLGWKPLFSVERGIGHSVQIRRAMQEAQP